jgi:hypothetical protein
MRRRSVLQFKRQVWRITSDAPQGRWVDPEDERIEDQPQPEERFGSGMRQSSFELAVGLEVKDATDTVPGELLDELFRNSDR